MAAPHMDTADPQRHLVRESSIVIHKQP